ncbi:MAG TPA: hypothetical protein PKM43_08435 [Verrucomicrobiota bacterium]|nr:hypothetical protein [Verrucomicrobiota bacterium]HRZ36151.1 hypothetical protein [Candidatus Paceibacterota bacterium]HRZ55055.1 hypothetical protein [Candidatus Paceibacterota bacterium]
MSLTHPTAALVSETKRFTLSLAILLGLATCGGFRSQASDAGELDPTFAPTRKEM